MWAGRQGSGQLRGLVSTGWALRPGLYGFRQWEFPVLSPITTSFSDPTPMSLHLSASMVPRPAQTCPGLATACAAPLQGDAILL